MISTFVRKHLRRKKGKYSIVKSHRRWLPAVLRKTRIISLDRNTRMYVNFGKGKIGVVSRQGKTTVQAGGNSKSGAFLRAQYDYSQRGRAYAYLKQHEAGVGAVGKIGQNVDVKIGVNTTEGPFIEGRYKRLKARIVQ